MVWVVAGAWGLAVLLALVVLGYAGYEVAWKARRLSGDLGGLERLQEDLTRLRGQANAAAHRIAALRTGE